MEKTALSGRSKISEELSAAIAERLVAGEFPVGAVLPSEVELAEAYAVSRPIAREAVQQLTYAGMLKVQHGKRTTVRGEDSWNVLSPSVQVAFERAGRGDELRAQLYEVRFILECASAQLAAARADEAEREAIDRICQETTEGALRDEPVESFLVRDRAFHEAIAAATGNPALRQLMQEVHGYLASSWEASQLRQEDVAEAARQHVSIGDAVEAGDAERARAAMADHITWAGEVEGAQRVTTTSMTHG